MFSMEPLGPLGMLAEVLVSPKIPFSRDLEIMEVGIIETGFPVLAFLHLDSATNRRKGLKQVQPCTDGKDL